MTDLAKALIARDYIHYNVFERIFDRVCQLAKQMGLHERGTVSENPTPEEVERQSVLWVLYSVDKERLFIRGPPCRIYMFECHLHLPQAEMCKQQIIRANLRLTCLVEEIYKHLYSPKASRQDIKTRHKVVHQLESRLENLAREAKDTLAAAQCTFNVDMTLSLQLKYALYVTMLLIHSRTMDEQKKQIRLHNARKALQIIKNLSDGSFTFSGYIGVLER